MANKQRRRPQTPKSRSLATRDMMLYAAQRGQAPTDKAAKAKALNAKPKHRNRGWED